jgi:hypothetical protein
MAQARTRRLEAQRAQASQHLTPHSLNAVLLHVDSLRCTARSGASERCLLSADSARYAPLGQWLCSPSRRDMRSRTDPPAAAVCPKTHAAASILSSTSRSRRRASASLNKPAQRRCACTYAAAAAACSLRTQERSCGADPCSSTRGRADAEGPCMDGPLRHLCPSGPGLLHRPQQHCSSSFPLRCCASSVCVTLRSTLCAALTATPGANIRMLPQHNEPPRTAMLGSAGAGEGAG